MNIYHKLDWDKCLSHEIFEAVKKGWPETDEEVHFFWGLAGKNRPEIAECMRLDKKWFMIDVGYFTEQITRYPEPKFHDYNKTYFRIVSKGLHTTRGAIGSPQRLNELKSKGIDVEFKGWKTGECKNVLVCPSSPQVTREINGMEQDEWINAMTIELRKHTNLPIVVRNKPRPNNEFWGTDIKDSLQDASVLVTNLSLAAIDAVLNKTPVICDGRYHICSPIASHEPKFVSRPMRPGRKTMDEWFKFVTQNQFTIPEIENGTAFEVMKTQLI